MSKKLDLNDIAKFEQAIAKKYGKELSEIEIAIMQERIKALSKEVEKAGVKEKDNIWAKFGLSGEALNKTKENLKIAVDQIKQIFQQFAEDRIAQAELIVQQADREVEAAENELNRQIELREQGYANNVDDARRELQLQKSAQKEAIAEQRKAQKLKQAIDTAEQVSSIITASANILKGWSTIPFIGQVLGIAAIATMIGSFVLSKAKIRTQAKEQFGKGDYIDLEGGSHASGNDIPFGQRKGKVMTAEGGESMAVFNKKARNKYGKFLPGLVSDINKGRLEERYQNAFNVNIPDDKFNEAGLDNEELRLIRGVLNNIYDQGKENATIDKKGRRIVKNGNITRIIN